MRALLFSITLLFSSFLLFLVQPMIGRMLLPSLGGTPAVWNGCMVFFQAVLLGGYAWAHYGPSRLGLRNHLLVHLLLMGAVCFFLPIQLNHAWTVPTTGNPLGWLIGQLALCVGLPFFVISSSAPLLQRWFSVSGPESESDQPWFLYAVSNVGSLAALISYPFVFERIVGLTDQRFLWAVGFVLMATQFLGCAWLTLKNATRESLLAVGEKQNAVPLDWQRRIRYIILAAIPSSLMLGVTTVVSTEVGSFPLMWSIPLALYLLTFVFVFAKRVVLPHSLMVRAMPILLLAMPIMGALNMASSPVMMLATYFVTFFVTAMVCHGELARQRPEVSQLTEFYLMMSIGGVVGGAVNSLLAPVLFSSILEFPLMLVAACWVVPDLKSGLRERDGVSKGKPSPQPSPKGRGGICHPPAGRVARHERGGPSVTFIRSWAGPIILALIIFVMWPIRDVISSLAPPLPALIAFGIPSLICFALADSPRKFAVGFALIVFVCPNFVGDRDLILRKRGFFGVNEIAHVSDGQFRMLVNGRTMHGLQRSDQAESPDPLTYYHREGPMGDIFRLHGKQQQRIAVVGLGVGTMAAYSQSGQTMDFFEIDPIVCEIAQDQRYFNFLSSASGNVSLVTGDARIQLAQFRDRWQLASGAQAGRTKVSLTADTSSTGDRYGLIVLDAFGSDAVPLHLLTQDAVRLYLDLLDEDGLLAVHISSNFMDFQPVGAGIAQATGLHAAIRYDQAPENLGDSDGRASSRYMLFSRKKSIVERFLNAGSGWKTLDATSSLIWTDEHANVLDAIKW